MRKQDSFFILLWKIATLYTWPLKKWVQRQASVNMDVFVNQFPSLTGKTNTGLRQWPLILASLHAESIFHLHIQKEKISKYWDNGVGKWVFIFLPSIAILRIGPLKNFGFKFQPPCQSNNYPQRKLYQINPKLTSIIQFLKDL